MSAVTQLKEQLHRLSIEANQDQAPVHRGSQEGYGCSTRPGSMPKVTRPVSCAALAQHER